MVVINYELLRQGKLSLIPLKILRERTSINELGLKGPVLYQKQEW